MSAGIKADAGGSYGALQLNGADALPFNASGSGVLGIFTITRVA